MCPVPLILTSQERWMSLLPFSGFFSTQRITGLRLISVERWHLLTEYFHLFICFTLWNCSIHRRIQLKLNLREHPPFGSSHSREHVVSLYMDVTSVWPAASVGSDRWSGSVDVVCGNLQEHLNQFCIFWEGWVHNFNLIRTSIQPHAFSWKSKQK